LTHPSGTIAALPSLEKVANTNTKYNVSQDVALNLEAPLSPQRGRGSHPPSGRDLLL
jgi:hypothetical protein